jgi:hypothetical protein
MYLKLELLKKNIGADDQEGEISFNQDQEVARPITLEIIID